MTETGFATSKHIDGEWRSSPRYSANALSAGPSALPLDAIEPLLRQLMAIDAVAKGI